MSTTDPDRWNRLKELVAAADGLGDKERWAFFNLECDDDSELRQELESLFASPQKQVESFLSRAAIGGLGIGPLAEGSQVGAFRILGSIGAGGMGDVYLAERCDGAYERRVALKVIRLQGGPGELKDRFLAERRLMAELQHPNIASLLDAGTLDDGRPYFVMELVEGVPIDDYCTRHRLTVQQRIDLMIQVANAVAYAHRNLIVHRDLKPANILVSNDGVPKLLDFGIAKDLSDLGKTPATRLAAPMTPEYASPEQITGGVVGTTSDVYALGVLLYSLLTGASPFGGRQDPFAGRSRQSPPTRPSRRASELTDSPCPATELRGDLDELILKALQPDPDQRYSSVEALGRDLGNFVAGRPLEIRQGRLYRARKWLQRNAPVLLGVSVVLGILVGWGSAELEQRHTEKREKAISEHTTRLNDYLVEVLNAGKPAQSGETSPTFERIVQKAADLLEKEGAFQEMPLVRASLLSTVGTTWRHLGRYEDALPILEESLEIRRRLSAPNDSVIARSANNLAGCFYGLKQYPKARDLYLESQDILSQALTQVEGAAKDERARELASTWNNLAKVETKLGNLFEAVDLQFQALAIKRETAPNDPVVQSKAHYNLAVALLTAGRLDEAQTHLNTAVAQMGELHPEDSRRPAIQSSLLHHQGVLAREQNQLGKAADLLERAWDQRRSVYGADHPKTLESRDAFKNLAESQK